MSQDSNASVERFPDQEQKLLDRFVFADREKLEAAVGMELERIATLARSDKGRQELLQRIKERANDMDPALSQEDIDAAARLLGINAEQLEKKSTFFKDMLALPGKGLEALKTTGKFLANNKVLALIALAVASWQLPKLIQFFAAKEGVEAGNAVAKAGEFLKSFVPFSGGTTGTAPEVAMGPIPGAP
ncbi:MAG: hypothetical protein PHZ00_02655 [Candidatus Peribacteraceae bacterium]|nr:hypothetical protein [Candidatus Peribacteraceae bacterium]